MTTHTEMRAKHAKRIAELLMRFSKTSFSNETSLVNFIISGGDLKELLESTYSERRHAIINEKIDSIMSATSLSIVIGNDPEDFINSYARALSNTREAALLSTHLVKHE